MNRSRRLLAGYSATLAAGLGSQDWDRKLYYDPLVALLEPGGGMRTVLSHQGLSAASVLGKVTRELHLAVPPGENARISRAEAEANRIALNDENAR